MAPAPPFALGLLNKPATTWGEAMNRGVIGTIIGVLVVIILVLVIMRLM
jgi:hypothetical protein